MQKFSRFVAVAFLSLGAVAFSGCGTSSLPASESGGFAGGTGAFGEDPAGAGRYHSNIATASQAAPAQPVEAASAH